MIRCAEVGVPIDRLQNGSEGSDPTAVLAATGSAIAAIVAAAIASYRRWGGPRKSEAEKQLSQPDQVFSAAWHLLDALQREIDRKNARIEQLERQRDEDEAELRRLRWERER